MNIRRTRYLAILLGAALCSTLAQAQTPSKKASPNRDPFVNLTGVDTPVGKPLPSSKPPRTTQPAPRAQRPSQAPALGVLPPPTANVQGIIQSATGNRALLTTSTRTYLVKAGDKVGDYTVAAISSKNVTFSYKGSTVKLPMKSEFTALNTHPTKKK